MTGYWPSLMTKHPLLQVPWSDTLYLILLISPAVFVKYWLNYYEEALLLSLGRQTMNGIFSQPYFPSQIWMLIAAALLFLTSILSTHTCTHHIYHTHVPTPSIHTYTIHTYTCTIHHRPTHTQLLFSSHHFIEHCVEDSIQGNYVRKRN